MKYVFWMSSGEKDMPYDYEFLVEPEDRNRKRIRHFQKISESCYPLFVINVSRYFFNPLFALSPVGR